MTTSQVAHVEFFSDVLCIWAYIGQTRVDELKEQFGNRVELTPRFMAVFGDVKTKVEVGWSERGGISGYNDHVQRACSAFPEIPIHPRCWSEASPRSSLPAHLHLKAVALLEDEGQAPQGAAWKTMRLVRRAFFVEAADISDRRTLAMICEEAELSPDRVATKIDDGSAFASLSADLDRMRKDDITMSPTLSFNQGRQRLQGNVGYRLMEANVQELLDVVHHGASWC